MTDTHSHIIWGVDDGSEDFETSLKMLKQAEESGTTHIFATPHVLEISTMPSWKTILDKTTILQAKAKEIGLAIKIFPAAEIYMNWDLLPFIGKDSAYCINGGNYVLIELPQTHIPQYADSFLFELQVKGLTPLLAHAERYPALSDKPELLLQWRQKGVLLQLSIGSLLGIFGQHAQEMAKCYLKNNIVDVVGSDAHGTFHRTTDIKNALEAMKNITKQEQYTKITETNPAKILAGEEIELYCPEKIAREKPKKSFWKKIFG